MCFIADNTRRGFKSELCPELAGVIFQPVDVFHSGQTSISTPFYER